MSNPKLRFRFHEPDIDTNAPLSNGSVTIDGFDLECVSGEADAWDQGFGALVGLREADVAYVSIPAFPNRKFRQSYIQVGAATGIVAPKDLEGRRVGISSWSNTAGMWARGALQNFYGVDLGSIDWIGARTKIAYPPEGVVIRSLPDREDADEPLDPFLDRLLIAGELDAVISPNILPSISRRDTRTRRMFVDYKAAEQAYFRETGIFPISHVVTMAGEFVAKYPEAPVALLEAYRRARDMAFQRIEGSDTAVLTISWASALMAEQRELMGDDYWAYNVERNVRSLEAVTQFAFQQGLTKERLDYRTFFSEGAAGHPGS